MDFLAFDLEAHLKRGLCYVVNVYKSCIVINKLRMGKHDDGLYLKLLDRKEVISMILKEIFILYQYY